MEDGTVVVVLMGRGLIVKEWERERVGEEREIRNGKEWERKRATEGKKEIRA